MNLLRFCFLASVTLFCSPLLIVSFLAVAGFC
jgi:hypothetical protein